MLTSLILAWFSVLFAALTALKFIARISGCQPLMQFFHKIHIPFGILLLMTGLLHGLLAGNPPGTGLGQLRLGAILFTWNWGSACYLLVVLLGTTYLLRKRLKKRWMTLHRILTILLILTLILHLFATGITIFDRLNQHNNAKGGSTKVTDAVREQDTTASPDASDRTQTSESVETTTDTTSSGTTEHSFQGVILKDGTYRGSAQGYKSTITVSVTIENGEVTDIEVVSAQDTQNFFQKALGVVSKIINGQTLEVDAVAGATFSSAGLVNAVYDALENAVESGTLKVTEFDLNNVKRH